jgi:hypothetical protein
MERGDSGRTRINSTGTPASRKCSPPCDLRLFCPDYDTLVSDSGQKSRLRKSASLHANSSKVAPVRRPKSLSSPTVVRSEATACDLAAIRRRSFEVGFQPQRSEVNARAGKPRPYPSADGLRPCRALVRPFFRTRVHDKTGEKCLNSIGGSRRCLALYGAGRRFICPVESSRKHAER